jgi:hypothetical protein
MTSSLTGPIAASRRRAVAASGYAAAVLADAPTLYLRFEETSGATCADSSGNARTGTAAGAFTRNVAGATSGGGIAIGLAAAEVTVPDVAALDIVGDVTYEAWILLTSFTVFHTLISKGQQSAGVAGYQFRVDQTTRKLTVNKASTSGLLTSTGAVPADSAWHHVAFTRAGNVYTAYIDGASAGTATIATTIDATNQVLGIGASFVGAVAQERLTGTIDEVAVYPSALSGARIAAHFAAR